MLEESADTLLDISCVPAQALWDEQYFATAPLFSLPIKQSARHESEDEALYTQFEEAISERVARVSRQLSQISYPALASGRANVYASTRSTGAPEMPLLAFFATKQRQIRQVCLGISLLLLGFNLMGLFILLR
jgi:hypothetical protein